MKRSTPRRAVLMSALSLLLCISMLLGTTFAWFTDSVTATNNVIVAGNLDIELYHTNKTDTEEKVEETTKLFDDVTLWEPGAVAFETFTVKNEGTLALKYRFDLNRLGAEDINTVTWDGDTNTYDLTDVIKVAIVEDPAFSGTREDAQELSYVSWHTAASDAVYSASLEPGADSCFTVVLYWEPSASDNLYNLKNTGWTLDKADPNGNNVLFINTGVALVATQSVYEYDSFDNTYDRDAQVPGAPVIKSSNAVSKTSDEDVTLNFTGVTPEDNGDTVVNFPAGSFTAADEELNVSVETKNQLAANPSFQIEADGVGVIATVDLTATVGGTQVTTFNGQYATIETYIEKGFDAADVVLTYVDDAGVKTSADASNGDFEIVSYDSATGKLVFRTNHFSTFELTAPYVTLVEEGVYAINDVRGFFAMANAEDGTTFVVAETYEITDETVAAANELVEAGYSLEVSGDVTLDTGSFKKNLSGLPITVAEDATLTLEGDAEIDKETLESISSGGEIDINGGDYAYNPALLDETLLGDDSEYIAVNYVKDGVTRYVVSDRATTVVLAAPDTVYTSENGNYTVKTVASGKLYAEFSAIQNNDHSTVFMLPGTYNEGTTVNVYSSVDIIGLGDKEAIKVVKQSSSSSNRHLFNCNGSKADYIQVSIRNMTLDATAKTTNNKDNAAVQSIRKTKVKCYDLDIIKGTGFDAVAFYVNGNNAVDGVKYKAYLHAENCTLNTTRTYGIVTTAGSYCFTYHNLKYAEGASEYTTTSSSIKNIELPYDDWDW